MRPYEYEWRLAAVIIAEQGFRLVGYNDIYDAWVVMDSECPLSDDLEYYVAREGFELGRQRS